LGIIGSLLFFRLKKQKTAKAKEVVIEREVKYDNFDRESKIQEEMHVDWDKIDGQFDSGSVIQYHLSPTLERLSVRAYSPNTYEQIPPSPQTPDVKLSFLPSDSSSSAYRHMLGDQYTTTTSSSFNDGILTKPDVGRGIINHIHVGP
jgi:hypothetical protein